MATITADANLYNSFRVLLVEHNASASLSMPTSIECDFIRIRGFEQEGSSSSNLTFDGNFLFKGGVAKLDNKLQSTASLRQYFSTYVRIDVDELMDRGLPEGTDITFKMQEGFLKEDTFKYPSAEGYEFPSDDNFFTMRTPWKGTGRLNSQFNLPGEFPYRLRRYSSNFQSLFTPNAFAVGNFVGELAMGSFTNMSSLVGGIYPIDINPQTVQLNLNINPQWIRFMIFNEEWINNFIYNIDFTRVRYFNSVSQAVDNFDCESYRYHGIIETLPVVSTVNANVYNIKQFDADLETTWNIDPVTNLVIIDYEFEDAFNASLTCATTVFYNSLNETLEFSSALDIDFATELVYDTTANRFSPNTSLQPSMFIFGIDPVDGLSIDWGDGTVTNTTTDGMQTHKYASSGTYTIRIEGTFEQFGRTYTGTGSYSSGTYPRSYSYYSQDRYGFERVNKWGYHKTTNFDACFEWMEELVYVPDLPQSGTSFKNFLNRCKYSDNSMSSWNTSNLTDMSYFFAGWRPTVRSAVNPLDLNSWDTSNVTNMNYCFNGDYVGDAFPQFSGWDISGLTSLEGFCYNANRYGVASFTNQWTVDLSSWDVSNITNFYLAFAYDSWSSKGLSVSLNGWDFSGTTNLYKFVYFNSRLQDTNNDFGTWIIGPNITSLQSVFEGVLTDVSSDLSNWDVSNVTNMRNAFRSTGYVTGLENWDVSKVTDFNGCFSQGGVGAGTEIVNWDVSSATNMASMFFYNGAFNQDISGWNVSNVTTMQSMFWGANAFNQDISNWDVSNVTNMNSMLRGQSGVTMTFEGDIRGWDVGSVISMFQMFQDNTTFDQDISGWNVRQIAQVPTNFSANTSANWTADEKPVWGTFGITKASLNSAYNLSANATPTFVRAFVINDALSANYELSTDTAIQTGTSFKWNGYAPALAFQPPSNAADNLVDLLPDDFTLEFYFKIPVGTPTSGIQGGLVTLHPVSDFPYNTYRQYTSETTYFNVRGGIEVGVESLSNGAEMRIRCRYGNSNTFAIPSSNINDFRNINNRLGDWIHIAVSKESNTLRMFMDGLLQSQGTVTEQTRTRGPIQLGVSPSVSVGARTAGFIDGIKLTNQAIYTASFTPPTEEIPDPLIQSYNAFNNGPPQPAVVFATDFREAYPPRYVEIINT